MAGYILNDKKSFEIFVRAEKAIKENLFPIMKKFENEEIAFWLETLNKYLTKESMIAELGCGSGRVINELYKKGYHPIGFDNDKFFIDHCRKRGITSNFLDATFKVPKEYRNKFDIIGIALNTLFNFDAPIREKWIKTSYEMLKERGYLLFSVYCDDEDSRKTIDERVEFYRQMILPPKGHKVDFFDETLLRGIYMTDINGKVEWKSLWIKKDELIKEINSCEGFKIISISPMKCKIAYNVLLKKI